MSEASHDTRLLAILAELQTGNCSGQALLEHVGSRLRRLAAAMLRRFPQVRRWEETDDVWQGAALRLVRSLEQVRPSTAREFFGLAALHIRRELIDLARKLHGPEGVGANHATWNSDQQGYLDAAAETSDPATILWWAEFHERAAALPEAERAVFDLLYYQGLTHADAAAVLGISERTCKRRYREAKLKLHAALAGAADESAI